MRFWPANGSPLPPPRRDAASYQLARPRRLEANGRRLDYIIALYARSLDDRYDVKEHPPFADYVSGVLWEHENVEGGGQLTNLPEQLEELKNRFPPRELEGMDSDFSWYPPKRKKQAKKRGRLNQARYDELKRQQLKHAKSINTQPARYRPIDESVKIPEAVRRAADRADRFCQASEGANSTQELNHADASGRV